MGEFQRSAGGLAIIISITVVTAFPAFSSSATETTHHPVGAGDRCLDCHTEASYREGLSHPVGVYPSTSVSDDLPLIAGRLGCITCHDPRADTPGLLREPAETLCISCHADRRSGRDSPHALHTVGAHLSDRSDRLAAGGIDLESAGCLGCHDGTVALGTSFRSPAWNGTEHLGAAAARHPFDAQHPIGARQEPRGSGDHLVEPHRLDVAIRLFDGRIGCGSCHSPYSPHESLLVMENRGSVLCLNCHDF